MNTIVKRMILLLILPGLLIIESCKDKDDPTPEPTITLQAEKVDGVRGSTVTITGSASAAAGLKSFTSNNTSLTITGITVDALLPVNFTATIALPDTQALGDLAIVFTLTDNQDRTVSKTFTINVVGKGTPTVALKTGSPSSAAKKRREKATISLTISAPEGIETLTVKDASGATVATVAGTAITNPADFSWEYTLPDALVVGTPFVLKHTVTDKLGRTSATSADFTVNAANFDNPTIAFTEIVSTVTQEFAAGTTTVKLTLGKDPLIKYKKLIVISTTTINSTSTETEVDLTAVTGTTYDYALTVDQQLFSENTRTFKLVDEFDKQPTPIFFTFRVIDPLATYTITNGVIGTTNVKIIAGNIDQVLTLVSTNTYALNGPVIVKPTGRLEIPAGINIYAITGGTLGTASLRAEIGGKILAEGTASAPVIFTSDKGLKSEVPAHGDWVGLRLDGNAANLNSGILKHVRIEYAGSSADGALRLTDAGNETLIDYLQIFKSKDHGIRLRGGNVNIKHIVVTDALKLSIRADDGSTIPVTGYSGKGQFIILNKATGQIDGTDTREITVRERASIHWSNVTFIGSGSAAPPLGGSSSNDGARINLVTSPVGAEVVGYKIVNAIMSDYPDDGLRDDTALPTGFSGSALLAYTTFQRVKGNACSNGISGSFCLLRGNALAFTAAEFNNTYNTANLDQEFIPGINVNSFVPNSVPVTTFNYDMAGYNDAFFDSSAKYAGAIGATDWTLGWVKNLNGTIR